MSAVSDAKTIVGAAAIGAVGIAAYKLYKKNEGVQKTVDYAANNLQQKLDDPLRIIPAFDVAKTIADSDFGRSVGEALDKTATVVQNIDWSDVGSKVIETAAAISLPNVVSTAAEQIQKINWNPTDTINNAGDKISSGLNSLFGFKIF